VIFLHYGITAFANAKPLFLDLCVGIDALHTVALQSFQIATARKMNDLTVFTAIKHFPLLRFLQDVFVPSAMIISNDEYKKTDL
jgi:hypothetical protein